MTRNRLEKPSRTSLLASWETNGPEKADRTWKASEACYGAPQKLAAQKCRQVVDRAAVSSARRVRDRYAGPQVCMTCFCPGI